MFIKQYISSRLESIADEVLKFYQDSEIRSKYFSDNLQGSVIETQVYDKDLIKYLKEDLIKEINFHMQDYFSIVKTLSITNYNLSHFSIMHYKEGFTIPFHYDSEFVYNGVELIRNFAVLLYLNDNFKQGELIFPLQKHNIKPKKGKLVIFPTSFMFPHTIAPSLGADRYVLRVSYYFDKNEIISTVKESRSY